MRHFSFNSFLIVTLVIISSCSQGVKQSKNEQRPNVIIILTDDQGYGDLGFNGNPHIKTPHIDELGQKGISMSNFYVSPVCAPTRSSLLTGRYSLRTGVRDTYNGGAIMANDEITLAEILKAEGYATGIFGKWHLGDNYPFRPIDQGFDESLVHLGGGLGQAGDWMNLHKWSTCYFDAGLMKNGQPVSSQGYCSDVFTDAALDYIDENKDNPFFMYLAYNAPHTPLQLPDEYYDLYKDIDPSAGFANSICLSMTEAEKEAARKVYGMMTNIDDNIGRLKEKLIQTGLAENTIVIFMSDNGPEHYRYLADLRAKKGKVYHGGIKVPCFINYPAKIKQPIQLNLHTAHIDIVPTVLDMCGINEIVLPASIDGISFYKQCIGQKATEEQKERDLYFYWSRRSIRKYHNMAVLNNKYKLVGNTTFDAKASDFELYNIEDDPFERDNIIEEHPEVAQALKEKMDAWYKDVLMDANTKNKKYTIIGTPNEHPTVLNRNDAFGMEAIWAQQKVFGYWDVDFQEAGNYDFNIAFMKPLNKAGELKVQIGSVYYVVQNEERDISEIRMNDLYIPKVKGELMVWYYQKGDEGKETLFPFYVEITKAL